MNKNVIIIGAGGHGKVIADIVALNNDTVTGFLDDRETAIADFNILGKVNDIAKYADGKTQFFIAVGNNHARKKIAETYSSVVGNCWYTAVHPTAVISEDSQIGLGTAVMALSVINPGAKIGNHCIINTASIIEHDNSISDFVHISPNSVITGTVNIGCCTWIGAGCAVCNNVSIADNCIIGAGSTVIRDITEPGTYVGSPARKIK